MIVYSNAASVGAKQGFEIYPELVAKTFNANLINNALQASCNRRILRTSVRDLLSLSTNEKVLCLIGLTFITRTELWQPNLPAIGNDGHFHAIQVNSEKHNWRNGIMSTIIPNIYQDADPTVQDYYKQWLTHMSKEAIITELLCDILMFQEFCAKKQISVLIWNNSDLWPGPPEVAVNDIFLQPLVDNVLRSKNILDPWSFSFSEFALQKGHKPYDQHLYGNSGHPNAHAHKDFADYLIDVVEKNKIL